MFDSLSQAAEGTRSMNTARLVRNAAVTAICFASTCELCFCQVQISRLVSPESTSYSRFGFALSADGRLAAIASLGEQRVHVFESTPSGLAFRQSLEAGGPFGGPSFGIGSSVDVSGSTIIAGDQAESHMGLTASGVAYVFERQNGRWTQAAQLAPSDPQLFATFGMSVAVDGSHVVVGAPQYNSLGGTANQGAAYVFRRTRGGWSQEQKLVPPDPKPSGWFGVAVDINDGVIAVGETVPTAATVGAVHVFEWENGYWAQSQRLVGSDALAGDGFGRSVSVARGLIAVGAPNHSPSPQNSGAGAVYAFTRAGDSWGETQKVLPADPTTDVSGRFGSAVDARDRRLVVGSPFDDDLGFGTGSVYVFERSPDAPDAIVQVGKYVPSSVSAGGPFGAGWDVALMDERILVGHPDQSSLLTSHGAAYVVEVAQGSYQFCSCGVDSPCLNETGHGGCKNSTGHGAVLQARGSVSIALDDLELESVRLPPNTFAVTLMGSPSTRTPLGDGKLCVSSGDSRALRIHSGTSSPMGSFLVGPGIVSSVREDNPRLERIQAGETWSFQTWFRDPSGPCGNASNLSNGVVVEFVQ